MKVRKFKINRAIGLTNYKHFYNAVEQKCPIGGVLKDFS